MGRVAFGRSQPFHYAISIILLPLGQFSAKGAVIAWERSASQEPGMANGRAESSYLLSHAASALAALLSLSASFCQMHKMKFFLFSEC